MPTPMDTSTFDRIRHATQQTAIPPSSIDPERFRDAFMHPNLPVILDSATAGTNEWRACKEWRIPYAREGRDSATSSCTSVSDDSCQFTPERIYNSLQGAKEIVQATLPGTKSTTAIPSPASRPNFVALKRIFGDLDEPVLIARVFEESTATANRQQTNAYGASTKEGKMMEFLQEWEAQTERRVHGDQPNLHELQYLKDWHIAQTHPTYDAYSVPKHFADDWMNYDSLTASASASSSSSTTASRPDDFRFCYAGARGTWTSMHSDVYNSYSWSANIVGRKLWIMWHPDWRPLLSISGTLMHDTIDITNPDVTLLPLSLARLNELAKQFATNHGSSASTTPESPTLPPCYVWIQDEGEIIFVPSGWLHQVHNLDDCISINHNWMNACNLKEMYAYLRKEWEAAIAAVQGFDFDAKGSIASSTPFMDPSASPSSSLTPLLVSNALMVMRSNTGMAWKEFNEFLEKHEKRFEKMEASDVQEFSPAVIQFTLDTIQSVRESMEKDCITAIFAFPSTEPSSTEAQIAVGEASENHSESSDSDWVPRRRTKGRRRVIRDDDDEEEEGVEDGNRSSKESARAHEDVAPSLELCGLSISSAHDLPTQPTIVQAMLGSRDVGPGQTSTIVTTQSKVIHPHGSLATLAMLQQPTEPVDVQPVQDEIALFHPRNALSVILKFVFQEFHAALMLPRFENGILDLIVEYSVPGILPTFAPSPPSSSPSPSRGPFFVALNHFANGDTFSEDYATERELVEGIREYTRTCRASIEATTEEAQEELGDILGQIDALDAAAASLRILLSTTSHSKGDIRASPSLAHSRRVQLDDLLQQALALGDEMVAAQLGYGWTHVHECNEKHSQ